MGADSVSVGTGLLSVWNAAAFHTLSVAPSVWSLTT